MNSSYLAYATGRRKEAVARIFLKAGSGQITVNRRAIEDYFGRATSQMIAKQPLELVDQLTRFDIIATVTGGGLSGQAAAMRLGISRALLDVDANLRPKLKVVGYLTRDSRMKERKKYGQRGARARFQFSKR
jgi:small subunit ribosomal protein S9